MSGPGGLPGAFVGAPAVAAPGLPGWSRSRAVLAGEQAYEAGVMLKFDGAWLSANERRRITPTARLALGVAREALSSTDLDPARVASVFACSGGDTDTLDKLCRALCMANRPVSPAQFHNSVHNAPAGYWSIASSSQQSSTSLSAYDGSFAAGLLDAYTMIAAGQGPVLLVAYDGPPPAALFPFRPVASPFAVALLLTPGPLGQPRGRISLSLVKEQAEHTMADDPLEALRKDNPAARSLPLLAALARGRAGRLVLPYLTDLQVAVEHEPC